MYTPSNCTTLDKSTADPQIRLGLQGYGGSGKTWAALTFPNPVVFNLDRGLGAHEGRADIIEVPAWDMVWCKKFMPSFSHASQLKDLIIQWIDREGMQLQVDQTFVMDGGTGLQNAYHGWWEINQTKFTTSSGAVDSFKEWSNKKRFFGEIMESLKRMRCNVVYLSHEADQKDKNSVNGATYSGKVRPLLTGAFGDELVGHFTDWFRQHSSAKPDIDKLDDVKLARDWMMTKSEFKAWAATQPRNTIHYWQTSSDDVFDAKASSLVNFPTYIPADFKSFERFKRKQ